MFLNLTIGTAGEYKIKRWNISSGSPVLAGYQRYTKYVIEVALMYSTMREQDNQSTDAICLVTTTNKMICQYPSANR